MELSPPIDHVMHKCILEEKKKKKLFIGGCADFPPVGRSAAAVPLVHAVMYHDISDTACLGRGS